MYCAADGSAIHPDDDFANQYWDPSLFLSITLPMGEFTFTAVKAIDICWDLIVGRGGQMLISLLVYPVMRRSMLTLLEHRSLRMSVVTSLVFEHCSIWSWWAVAKALLCSWSWGLLGFLYIIVYVLAFGTVVSAMTGYQADMSPFYESEGNLMDFSAVRIWPTYRVINADRLDLEPGVLVWASASDPNYPLVNCRALI